MPKLIGKILTDIIPVEHSWKIKLFTSWDAIIGNMKDKVRIEKITNSSVTLGVTHSTWAQELFFLTPLLKEKMNLVLQEEKIKTIKLKTVAFKSERKQTRKCEHERIDRLKQCTEHCLTITEHSTLQNVENKELAKQLEKFCLRCKKYNQKGSHVKQK